MNPPFSTRVYLGWITDLASAPDAFAAWPSMRRDAALLADYERQLDIIAELGFDALCVWGLAVSRDWPLDLERALTPEKREFAAALSELCRARDLKLLAGMGVFSWGFDAIIAAHPHLARTNPHALCPHEAQSWEWMKRVTDFVLTELPVDGVQMQSADHNRCRCAECASWNDLEHHAHLNGGVAAHIRAEFPHAMIGVNSWGMNFKDHDVLEKALPSLVEMSRKIDYFTEVENALGRDDSRRRIIEAFECDFGTLGGPQVEPPQHWARDKWFLPVAQRRSEHLKSLAQDGGKSCELFFHLDANPGDELSLWVAGYALQNPLENWENHLKRAVERIYAPKNQAATRTLCELFARAESAYFGRVPNSSERTFSLEPLCDSDHHGCDAAGPPIYLDCLEADERAAYAADLQALFPLLESLRGHVEDDEKLERIAACLKSVIADAKKS